MEAKRAKEQQSEHTASSTGISLRMSSGTRLDSWKEIAAYLNRNVRTAQRWEKFEGMPVQRHHHQKGSSVSASSEEIDAWLNGRCQVTEPALGRIEEVPLVEAAAANALRLKGARTRSLWYAMMEPQHERQHLRLRNIEGRGQVPRALILIR